MNKNNGCVRGLLKLFGMVWLLGCYGVTVSASESNHNALNIIGDWKQGSVLRGRVATGHSLYFLDRKVPLSQQGDFVIGLGRDFPAQATLTLVDQNGASETITHTVTQREYRIQRINGVPSQTVNPDPKHLARIRDEVSQTKKARADVSDRLDFLETFQWPLTGPITGVYGSQRYYNGAPRRPHFGVDVAAPTGTVVVAPASGKVTLAHPDMFFSGGTLIVDHGQGLSSSFIHLSKILVKVGEEVAQGQAIAEVGATGRVTGPHLDWRMNWFDQRVDPVTLVRPMEEVLAEGG